MQINLNLKTNFRHLVRAAQHSWKGLRAAYKTERAFRIELFLSIFILPTALFIGQTPLERALLISSWLFVLIMELVNTAIETIINRISHDHHPYSGKAKDIGSAIVFVAAVQTALFWVIVIFSRFAQ